MGKIGKILATLVTIFLVVIVGLVILVHLYVTEDRVRTLVIPPAEKALQRKVSLGTVKVSIFKGVIIRDLVVKEADGKRDFLKVKGFILKYKILPLLKKDLIITKILLIKPYARICRDSSGHFNFETLGPMKEKPSAPKGKEGKGIPVALTVHRIQVSKAHVVVQDALQEIPNTDITASSSISLSIDPKKALSFSGDTDFIVNLVHGQLKSLVKGKASFTPQKIAYNTTVETEGDTVTLSGQVADYMKQPSVVLNVYSPMLHLDRLMTLPEKLPKAKTQDKKGSGKASANPPKLEVKGDVQVKEALYKELKAKDIRGAYGLKDGIFTLQQVKAQVANGEVEKSLRVDTKSPLIAYQGETKAKGMDIGLLALPLLSKGKGMVTGTLDGQISFSGKGTQWETAKRWLSADGTFSLKNVRLSNFETIKVIAQILKLDELKDIAFNEIQGNLRVDKGHVLLKSSMKGDDVKARSQGQVGLDGSLNLPIMLQLSPKLSEKLRSRVKLARYLETKEGWTIVPLKLTGTLSRPLPILDTSSVKEGLEKSLKDEASKGLEKLLSGQKKKEEDSKSQPPEEKNPLKKLFGR
jgi:type II secretion system protein N